MLKAHPIPAKKAVTKSDGSNGTEKDTNTKAERNGIVYDKAFEQSKVEIDQNPKGYQVIQSTG